MDTTYIITPKSKVMDVIKAYPQLEEALVAKVPAFEKLKNPVLRNTVAKVATIQQAASIAHIEVGTLLNFLREKVGQTNEDIVHNSSNYNSDAPEWFSNDRITQSFDVREMLARGEHPVAQVIEDLKLMPHGQIYKLTASFLPAPLIDKAAGLGYDHYVGTFTDEQVDIYFCKKIINTH